MKYYTMLMIGLFMLNSTSFFSQTEEFYLECPDDQELDRWASNGDICNFDLVDPVGINSCGDYQLEYFQESIGEYCDEVIILNWTAYDECGFQASCSQTISMIDLTPPEIICPDDLTLLEGQVEDYGVAQSTDNSGESDLYFEDEFFESPNSTVIIRTWTAVDPCGNVGTCQQTISIINEGALEVDCLEDQSIEIGEEIPLIYPVTNGACEGLEFEYNDEYLEDGCADIIIRTWTVTDDCGQNATCQQSFFAEDSTPPNIVCPPDLIFECDQDPGFGNYGQATATDNSGNVNISSDQSIDSSNPCQIIKTVTWVATDECGNSDFCVQTILINDTTAPNIICPPDYNGSCTEINDDFGFPIVSDNCWLESDLTLSSSDVVTNPDPCTTLIVRTWLVSDPCQNSSTCTQVITLVDNSPPIIVCPPDATGECDQISVLFGSATATDDCTNSTDIVISYTDIYTIFDPCTAKIQRIWTATDNCLNSSSCTQNIFLYDTTAPTVICPADAQGDCTQIGDNFGNPVVFDNCSSTTVGFVDQVSNPDPCTTVITRLWTVEDACFNSTTCTQIITLDDNIFPVISCPPNATGDCTQINDNFGTATATDNCTNTTISYVDVISNPTPCTTLITRTWYATDECTNTSSCVQTITLTDTSPPVITCPIDTEGTCDPNENFGTATATDNCDPAPLISFSDQLIANSNCDYTLLRTWTATDVCGLQSSCVQTITLVDNTPPTITCPPDITVECDANQNYGTATATDFCSQNVSISYLDDISSTLCSTTITRVWMAIDDCNNVSTCSQIITIVDTTAPVINCPPNLNNVQCDFLLGLGIASASDNCTPTGEILLDYTDVISNGGICNYTITRTWTAEDYCGNISSCVQIIGVVDNVPPVIVCPPDMTLECGETTDYGVATANDNCQENVSLVFADVVTGNVCSSSGQVITRTWTADDGCGNSSSCVQTITLFDTTPPQINCPDDITVWANIGASGANVNFNVTATDLCDPSVQISCDSNSGDYFSCNQATLVTCTATDACGNTDMCSFSIVVNCITVVCDDIYSTIDASGGGLVAQPAFIASNGCGDDGDIELTFPDWPADDYFTDDTTMVTVIGTDECGNMGSCAFNVILDSTIHVADVWQMEDQVTLFPNPSKDEFSLSFDFTIDQFYLDIFDSAGRKVFSRRVRSETQQKNIDVSRFKSGWYTVLIYNENNWIRKKLIIQ